MFLVLLQFDEIKIMMMEMKFKKMRAHKLLQGHPTL